MKKRYYKSKSKKIKDEKMAFYRATYKDKEREWISVSVYIPHPKYKSNVETCEEITPKEIVNGTN